MTYFMFSRQWSRQRHSLEDGAMLSGRNIPTFPRNLLASSSEHLPSYSR